MKTPLPNKIETIEQAKELLNALHANAESYHPDEDAHTIVWKNTLPPDKAPTPAECNQLNKLMEDIYNLPGVPDEWDPCAHILQLTAPYDYHIDQCEGLITPGDVLTQSERKLLNKVLLWATNGMAFNLSYNAYFKYPDTDDTPLKLSGKEFKAIHKIIDNL